MPASEKIPRKNPKEECPMNEVPATPPPAHSLEAPQAHIVKLPLGSVAVYDFGEIRLHAYALDDALADECNLIENTEGLVMLETGAFTANLFEWKGYIEGLNMPSCRPATTPPRKGTPLPPKSPIWNGRWHRPLPARTPLPSPQP